MINLLIVDDERLLTDALKMEIDWGALGIGSVHTAYNSRQAKAVFEKETIDLMLCDIEMPQGSGLELLAWVRDNHPRTESVFMTCHAEFKLAQRAMQLGSFDYLLKPVPYDELSRVIGRAADKIRKENERNQYSRIGQFWSRHQPLLAERLWLDIIKQAIPANPTAIKKEAEERNIPFDERMRLLPILLCVDRYRKSLSIRDEKIMEYALTNSGEEMLNVKGNGLLIRLADRKLLALMPVERDEGRWLEECKARCEAFVASCLQYFYCDLSVYIGREVYGHELSEMVDRLLEWDKRNVAVSNKVFLWERRRASPEEIALPDMNVWSVMLKEGRGGQVVSEVEAFLSGFIGSERMDAENLHRFHHNLLQTVFYVLKLKGIEGHLLFDDTDSVDRFQRAVLSVEDMIEWARHTVHKAMEYMGTIQHSPSVIRRVEQYISQRIETEKLTREDVANHVFLNADYLDRILKKESGCSVTEFIVRKRMLLAQQLLERTNLPVGTIAGQAGYSNLAHFSRRFKKFAGVSPHDYRLLRSNR
ncbi:response regulator [Paenibacillus antri]|uniref:Response regulator n=1 Tax=Paenibacillus antri TaxID=2582848 RepID=A0A5R9GH01_9BACL|nr:response regulator [Paenibacillus antri]TLS53716.1 response regulator [Paenibacillus antri]